MSLFLCLVWIDRATTISIDQFAVFSRDEMSTWGKSSQSAWNPLLCPLYSLEIPLVFPKWPKATTSRRCVCRWWRIMYYLIGEVTIILYSYIVTEASMGIYIGKIVGSINRTFSFLAVGRKLGGARSRNIGAKINHRAVDQLVRQRLIIQGTPIFMTSILISR